MNDTNGPWMSRYAGSLRLSLLQVAILIFLPSLSACNDADFKGNSEDKAAPVVVLDQEFTAGSYGHTDVTANPLFGLVEQKFALAEKPPVVSTVKQLERVLNVDQYTQGHDGDSATETFSLTAPGKLDLLMVIDNSKSMETEQKKLASKLASLTKYLKSIDWQIAVVTTDNSCLRGGKVIKSTDANAAAAFESAVNAGITGSGDEAGILQALQALQGKCKTGDVSWVRSDSAVAVFFLSDEESYCTTGNCRKGDGPADLIAYMNGPQLNRGKEKLKAYGLLWNDQTDNTCTKDEPERQESFGSRYVQVLNEFSPGFSYGSICAADYSNVLEKISEDVSRALVRDFELKQVPVSSSVNIQVDGKPFTEFSLDGKKLTLNSALIGALTMKISYLYAPTPKFDHFKVTGTGDMSTLEVYLGKTKLDPSKYSFDSSSSDIVFVNMPPDDSVISIKYRASMPILPLTFDLSAVSIGGQPLEVQVAGTKQVENVDYFFDETSKILSFVNAPLDGAEIKVKHKPVDSHILRYKATIGNLENLQSFVVNDPATGDVIPAALEGNEIVFADMDFVADKEVVAVFDYGKALDALKFDLDFAPLEKSLKIVRADGTTDCISDIKLEKKLLTFNCDAEQLGEIKISYDYVAEIKSSFDVGQDFPASNSLWQVFVDKRAVNFTKGGTVISVDPKLVKVDSKVRVIVTQEQ